jgi:hypothetical protein
MRHTKRFIAAVAASLARHGKTASTVTSAGMHRMPRASTTYPRSLTELVSTDSFTTTPQHPQTSMALTIGVICRRGERRSNNKPSSEYELQYVEVVSRLDPIFHTS